MTEIMFSVAVIIDLPKSGRFWGRHSIAMARLLEFKPPRFLCRYLMSGTVINHAPADGTIDLVGHWLQADAKPHCRFGEGYVPNRRPGKEANHPSPQAQADDQDFH